MKFEKISEEALDGISHMLKALSDKMRMKIIRALHDGEKSVNEIVMAVDGLQANVSKHLQILSRVHLVKSRKEGTTVYYRVADPCIDAICQSVCDGYARLIEGELKKMKKRG